LQILLLLSPALLAVAGLIAAILVALSHPKI
jgi:hypothetical protein